MATVTENKVISNQVFTAIQQGKSYEAHTGTIIYANKYSGLQEVAMPDEFRTILDSSLGSIGTNPLQQLRAKLEGLPGGPWFLDSRNGTLYIHNRKFQEDVVHNYVYQAENGEVLQISFETQRTSRSLSHIKGGGIDPYSKNLIGTSTGITSESPGPGTPDTAPPSKNKTLTPEERNRLKSMSLTPQEALPIDALRNVNRTAKNWTDRQNSMYRAERQAQIWRVKRGETEAHYTGYKRGNTVKKQTQYQIQHTGLSKKDKWARHIVAKKLTPQDRIDMTTHAAQSWKAKHSKSEILAWARAYLGYGTHVIVAPVWSEQWVDPTRYSGKGMFNGNASKVSETGSATPDYYSKKLLDNKLKLMRLDPLIKITSPVTTVKGTAYGGREQAHYFRVKVFRYHYERAKVDSAQIVADYMIRMFKQIEGSGGNLGGSSNTGGGGGVKITIGGGSGGGSYTGSLGDDGTISENRHGNRGRRATEKKLVVNMKVIGRPSLETSQIIHIDNVGSKWSGDYYIKSVTHDMSSDSGYTCQLELQRNGSQAEIESVSVQASTEKVIRDNDSSNRDRKFTHTDTDSKSSKRDRKVYTPTRTTSTSSKPRNTKQADKK